MKFSLGSLFRFNRKNNSIFGDQKLSADQDRKRDKKLMTYKVKPQKYRVDLEVKNWKEGVILAEDDIHPRREFLYLLYRTATEDLHLLAQMRTAYFTIQMAPFKIMRNGVEDEEVKKLFETNWFLDYVQHAIDAEFYGHSLVEFSAPNEDGHITDILLVPREHVRPEYGDVVIRMGDVMGIPFRSGPFSKELIEIGTSHDLGLLKPLSKMVIRKDYNLVDWGRRNERFGMPFIICKTSSRDEKELDAKEDMLRNFGSNNYALFDDQDEIELKEPISNTGGGHRSYADFVKVVDDAISILVNGQTSTTDEKAHVGSAEVHERILNKYTLARMRRVQNSINCDLIPHLISKGYPLTDCELSFNDLEEKDEQQQTMNTEQQPGEAAPATDQKKKPASNSD